MTDDLRLAGVERGEALEFSVDGVPVLAYAGETVAAALLAAGRRRLRTTRRGGEARGLYCGMGSCYECVVHAGGREVRACLEPVAPGLEVRTRT